MAHAVKSRIFSLIQFLKFGIWRVKLSDLPKYKAFFYRQIRVIILTVRGFIKDECALRSSALTFFSFLSIVPVLATVFGIAKGFGLDEFLKKEINKLFAGQEKMLEQSMRFADNILDSASGGVITGISLAFLLFTVLRLFNNIEESFNTIWQIKKNRTWDRKFADYTSIILIAPILVILSSSMNVFITTQVTYLANQIELFGWIKPMIFFGLRFIPYTFLWIVFSMFYIIMPNTSVRLKSAIIAGILAGTAYVFTQWGYINFQVGVARYNAIYGSFAALPLFLLWLQLSWFIVLFGAEYSFAHQNVDKYEFDDDSLRISPAMKKKISLLIMRLLIIQFKSEKDPLTADEISKKIGVPIRFVSVMLKDLHEAHLLSETLLPNNTDHAYQPSIDINKITIQYVLDKLDNRGLSNVSLHPSEDFQEISESLQTFSHLIQKSDHNKLLKDL